MTDVQIQGTFVISGTTRIDVESQVLSAVADGDRILVLIDPDSYLADPEYRRKRRAGSPAVQNFRAFSATGDALWAAEMPEAADYYHHIVSTRPIVVDSFSGFRCRISPHTGKIESREFMK
jgi:hypothetical protein